MDYWQKQTIDTPLFPELLWSRPENKALAGKLLIIGGNAYGFAAPAEAYAEAIQAGIGTAHVLLPDAVKPIVGKVLEVGDYAISTPSGSFSQKALGDLLTHAEWADDVLLAGDLGRNSETAILLEKFAEKYIGQLAITKDAADYFSNNPKQLLGRRQTLLVVSFAQLQKIAMHAGFAKPFIFDMGVIQFVEYLHELSLMYPAFIITHHLDNYFVAVGGQVSSTKLPTMLEIWRVKAASHATVWWLQNPSKPFEALTTSLVTMNQNATGA